MNSDIAKLAALPLVQAAIRAQAEAAEATALDVRLACLDAYQQAGDELAELGRRAADLNAMQDELDRQRKELAGQLEAHAIERQGVETRQRMAARELRQNHGSALAADVARLLQGQAESLRREAAYLRSLRERKPGWGGSMIESPVPDAMRKAAELERKAERFERERETIEQLQFARLSPQSIARDIKARVAGQGFTLQSAIVQEGWRSEGWEGVPNTKAAEA